MTDRIIKRDRKSNAMDFDKILQQVGHFGKYQKLRILFLMLGPLCGGIAVTSFIFTGKAIFRFMYLKRTHFYMCNINIHRLHNIDQCHFPI